MSKATIFFTAWVLLTITCLFGIAAFISFPPTWLGFFGVLALFIIAIIALSKSTLYIFE